ncbi:MAG: sulfur oxidation c-type cytochrome SoxA [Thiohalomonadaceae bacterium]
MHAIALFALLWGAAVSAMEPRSGYDYLPDEFKAMQDDPFENPGMFTVDLGRELFNTPGDDGTSCADCHGRDGEKLDPKRIARYPVYSNTLKAPVTLQKQIDLCREERMGEFPLTYDDPALVALETFVRHRARGEPVNVDVSGPMRAHYEAGERLFRTRIGQLQMACYHCHELYTGANLRDQVLNQAHTNGFPTHRLLTQNISSLHGKFRDCFATLRAMPYQPGSEEYIDLEVYMHARGNGLPIETPGIRR